ncbi:MAG: ABC transporter permease [Bryobacterales bacterium]|nr:ABC transporter permease [Bryobacterales bacterium]MBV9399322.1 ABC transporter permease [Bryobacterales bacterium]
MSSFLRKLRGLFGRAKREQDLDAELEFHLAEEMEDGALDEARQSLGNLARIKEDTREAWGFPLFETTAQDIRIALRALRKNPGFSIAAISILSLGIGSSTAMFSVLNAVILKPLALSNPERVVALRSLNDKTGAHFQVSIPDFNDWQAQSTSFESLAYYDMREAAVMLDAGPQFARISAVSPGFFPVLGVSPAGGRLFDDRETAPGANGAAIVSDAFARMHFNGDALGKKARIGGHVLEIVGVMPAGFRFPRADVWIPVDTVYREIAPNRGAHNYLAVGRLKNAATLASAHQELKVVAARLEREYPNSNANKGVSVAPLGNEIARGWTTMLYVLLGAVLLLLLIACANVANLLLARAGARAREIGLRAALGAVQLRIVRQLVTESLVLGSLSGLLGQVLAYFGTSALVALAPPNVPRIEEVSIDFRVLGFAIGLTIAACMVFGVLPAIRASRVDLLQALKLGRGLQESHAPLHGALVAAEVAFSVLLLAGAGLLLRSFDRLTRVALGFDTQQVLVMETSNPVSDQPGAARVVRRYQALLGEIARVPGVAAVAAARIPPGEVASDGAYVVDGDISKLSISSPMAAYSVVSPGVFTVLGIPLLRGRDFTDADMPDAPLTAIVNETLAKAAFPHGDAIGHSIVCGMDTLKPMTIIGVVADIHQKGPGQEVMAEIYMPYIQHPRPSTSLRILARTSTKPESLTSALRQKASEAMPEMPVKFTTMQARLSENVAVPRFRTLLLSLFAAVALTLTLVGIYGVVAFVMSRRTQEIGLRMALGATSPGIVTLVLSQGIRVALVGLTAGLLAAPLGARWLNSMLFEVGPLDLPTYAAVAGLMLIAAAVACIVPAAKAARMHPMAALRQE